MMERKITEIQQRPPGHRAQTTPENTRSPIYSPGWSTPEHLVITTPKEVDWSPPSSPTMFMQPTTWSKLEALPQQALPLQEQLQPGSLEPPPGFSQPPTQQQVPQQNQYMMCQSCGKNLPSVENKEERKNIQHNKQNHDTISEHFSMFPHVVGDQAALVTEAMGNQNQALQLHQSTFCR